MLEKVSIIIPFQTDNGPRAEAFKWIKQYYDHVMPEAELCLGIIDKDEINKSKAVNLAAKKATREIFVIADADIIFDPKLIVKAIEVLNEAAWVVPFTGIYDIERSGTERLLKTTPKWPIDVKSEECTKANWIYKGFAGKLIVIPRVNFEAVGGFDERFSGWGGEDDAFSLSVQTLCGKLVNSKGDIYHLWHPTSNYETNPNGEANRALLNRYKRASGNKKEIIKLISERKNDIEKIQLNNIKILNSNENAYMRSPKSKICFAILVHENRELVKKLIDNVRYYCPNSAIVLYNGGHDWTLCEGLGVPVCPSSRKLKYGYTAIYFLETMEWLEELGINYEYFINIDSDALFIKKGYEEFIQTEMKDSDYMGVKLRIPSEDWFIGKELKKDINRWRKLFNVKPLYGVFNVGQVISRSLVKALLEPERKEKLRKALLETTSWGVDEIVFVNMAKELGFRQKNYPNPLDSKMVRYRPYFTLDEIIYYYLSDNSGYLCHPIIRDENNPARKLIQHIERGHNSEIYKNRKYPWYERNPNNYSIYLPIKDESDDLNLIVYSGSSLTHYWQHTDGKWYKTQTFARGVTGIPIFFETHSGVLGVVCKLKNGGVGFWQRDQNTQGNHWYGSVFQLESVELARGRGTAMHKATLGMEPLFFSLRM
ncbi:galactosyltransferase-related protein [Peribacillus asahii]|uniref:galactosyltransferase-related protein n=1 Tax=Peribacillus asahii TaxID=228899 RepID=UPI00380B91FD